jgi:hypothetical protein
VKDDEDEEEYDEECGIMCCHDENSELARKVKKKVLTGLSEDLEGRGNVVMTRLNDDDVKLIDALVEVEAFKSRSEAAAFFIKEGIHARKDLFEKVMPTVDKIRDLKEQAKKSLGRD